MKRPIFLKGFQIPSPYLLKVNDDWRSRMTGKYQNQLTEEHIAKIIAFANIARDSTYVLESVVGLRK